MLPAAFSSAVFLAQATAAAAPHSDKLDASNPTVFMGLLMGAIITLATGANQIDSIIQRRKRTPSVDVDLGGLKSSIDALAVTVSDLKAAKEDHNGHKERIASLERDRDALKAQLEREIAAQRSYVAKSSREIFERIEGVEKSVAANFQNVERGLGRVEGALNTLAASKSQ